MPAPTLPPALEVPPPPPSGINHYKKRSPIPGAWNVTLGNSLPSSRASGAPATTRAAIQTSQPRARPTLQTRSASDSLRDPISPWPSYLHTSSLGPSRTLILTHTSPTSNLDPPPKAWPASSRGPERPGSQPAAPRWGHPDRQLP